MPVYFWSSVEIDMLDKYEEVFMQSLGLELYRHINIRTIQYEEGLQISWIVLQEDKKIILTSQFIFYDSLIFVINMLVLINAELLKCQQTENIPYSLFLNERKGCYLSEYGNVNMLSKASHHLSSLGVCLCECVPRIAWT